MFQMGPGEGYHAAKDRALAIEPSLVCRAVFYAGKVAGYRVEWPDGRKFADGAMMARNAWNNALDKLTKEGRTE